jgi:hypothetical protein
VIALHEKVQSAELLLLSQTSPTATIPLDIFGVIAEWLVAQNLHGTCASLNLASRHVQDETRPVLWRRVVYRFNNGPSNKKKAGTRWRITFGSVGAQYMQSVMSLATDACVYHFRIHRYLTVVPSILPEFGNDVAPWEPPFLGLITSRRNKMKACLIPGKMSTVSVTLFSGYEPGTSHLGQVMSCAGLLRRMTDGHASVALIRLYKQTRTLRGEVDNRELEDAFNRHHHNIETSTVGHVPFSDIRLLLTRHETLSNDFMARLSVDVISWLSLGVYACCDERLGHDQQWELAGLMRLMVYVSHFDQAVAFGRAVRQRRILRNSASWLTHSHSSEQHTVSMPVSLAFGLESRPELHSRKVKRGDF